MDLMNFFIGQGPFIRPENQRIRHTFFTFPNLLPGKHIKQGYRFKQILQATFRIPASIRWPGTFSSTVTAGHGLRG